MGGGPTRPAGVRIRPERPEEVASIRSVVSAAFGSDAVADLVDRIRDSPEYVPEMALVAAHAGAVLGHVMISGATVRSDAGSVPIVTLSPLAVEPAWQRLGIGGALVGMAHRTCTIDPQNYKQGVAGSSRGARSATTQRAVAS